MSLFRVWKFAFRQRGIWDFPAKISVALIFVIVKKIGKR